jgi:hypothetical protein
VEHGQVNTDGIRDDWISDDGSSDDQIGEKGSTGVMATRSSPVGRSAALSSTR